MIGAMRPLGFTAGAPFRPACGHALPAECGPAGPRARLCPAGVRTTKSECARERRQPWQRGAWLATHRVHVHPAAGPCGVSSACAAGSRVVLAFRDRKWGLGLRCWAAAGAQLARKGQRLQGHTAASSPRQDRAAPRALSLTRRLGALFADDLAAHGGEVPSSRAAQMRQRKRAGVRAVSAGFRSSTHGLERNVLTLRGSGVAFWAVSTADCVYTGVRDGQGPDL